MLFSSHRILEVIILILILEKEQIGFYSSEGNEKVDAISYSMDGKKSDQFFINNQKGYITPNYVNTLPPRKPIAGGQIETVEEVSFYIYNSFQQRTPIMMAQRN